MKTFDCEICGKIDTALLDGYSFGDRLLDGVSFEIQHHDDGKWSAKVVPEAAKYFSGLNTKKWLKEAEQFAAQNDIFECPTCKTDVVPD